MSEQQKQQTDGNISTSVIQSMVFDVSKSNKTIALET